LRLVFKNQTERMAIYKFSNDSLPIPVLNRFFIGAFLFCSIVLQKYETINTNNIFNQSLLKTTIMKKLFFILPAFFAIQFTGNAQSSRIGFTAGTSFANYNSKLDEGSDNGHSVTGITAGTFVDIPISKNFSFQPAVNFVQKGTKEEFSEGDFKETMKVTVNCIEVPLNFLYNSAGNKGNFFIGAGPSLTFSLSGKVTVDNGSNSQSAKLEFGSGEDADLKGFDFGANFTTGYCFKNGLLLSANYHAGLTNLIPGGSDNGTVKSHYFGIKLGYLLKGKAKN